MENEKKQASELFGRDIPNHAHEPEPMSNANKPTSKPKAYDQPEEWVKGETAAEWLPEGFRDWKDKDYDDYVENALSVQADPKSDDYWTYFINEESDGYNDLNSEMNAVARKLWRDKLYGNPNVPWDGYAETETYDDSWYPYYSALVRAYNRRNPEKQIKLTGNVDEDYPQNVEFDAWN